MVAWLRRCLILTLIFSPTTVLAEVPSLQWQNLASQTQLGRPLTAQLTATGVQQALGRIDLSALRSAFGVVIDNVRKDTINGRSVQRLTLKLYPRTTGTLTIAPLQLDSARTDLRRVTVTEANLGDGPVRVTSASSTTRAWERQQIIVQMEVRSRQAFDTLESDQNDFPGFKAIRLPPSHDKEIDDGLTYFVHRIAWALFPLRAGRLPLVLPPVRYVRNGLTQRVFYAPLNTLDVRALPAYIAPVIPVGAVHIESSVTPSSPLRTGTLAYWNVTVRGNGVPAQWLPPVLGDISNNASIRYFPAHSQRTDRLTPQGVEGQLQLKIPFKPLQSGRVVLPKLRMQFFDPLRGRLVSRQIDSPSRLSISLFIWITTCLALTLLLVWFSLRTIRWLQQQRRRRNLRQRAYSCIENAHDAFQLRDGLRLLADAERWNPNVTVNEWRAKWAARYRLDAGLSEGLMQLSRACYGPRSDNTEALDAIRHCLLETARPARFRWPPVRLRRRSELSRDRR